MATTDITLTPARLTAITGLTGLRVECSSAPARGMAGDAVGVGVVGVMVAAAGATDAVAMATDAVAMATAMVAGSLADADFTVDTAMLAVRLAGTTLAERFTAVLWPMAVADSTAEAAVVSMVVAVDTAAAVGTGNRGLIGSL
jgi:hypothetical protein